jgi:hypothetical protein
MLFHRGAIFATMPKIEGNAGSAVISGGPVAIGQDQRRTWFR